ncbi:tripartite motif-containing protein 15-like, partial [Terrapene carolina triunguis]|uniref:tripartite motif-containing protein 15-like n=1 Tax=Terrapene triunguis TaxID=2587831 RepID=UPI001156AA8D
KQLETERQKIVAEFQQLRQFLEEQERLLLAQLEELNQEIEKRRAEYVAKLSEELSSFSSLISEMEQKCQLPASEFLQDIKSTLSR